jgi:predicted TIM-barrel fold metal-dependent hydrolase
MTDFPIVDPHQHFWDIGRNYYPWLSDKPMRFRYGDYSALKRNYLPPDYRRDAGELTIVKTVHEEALFDPDDLVGETRWLDEIAAEYGLPSAAVGRAIPDRDDIDEVLAGHAESPLMRGIRHFPAAAANPRDARRGAAGSMDDPKWRNGYALLEKYELSFDLQTPWWHLDAAAELGADFPRIQMIIVHTGLPHDRSPEGLAGWRRAMELIAAHQNIAVKISGLGQPGLPWTLEANEKIIRDTIAMFGTERAMFASNFPVDGLSAPLATIYAGYRAAVADLAPEDQRKLFHDNAVRIYRL